MTRRMYVAFVRAVMIGRDGLHRDVLLDIVERAGGTDPTSYISTGNVSFGADEAQIDESVEWIEADIERVVGRITPVYVRSVEYLIEMVERDPFESSPIDRPDARLVTFLRGRVPDRFALPILSDRGDYHVFGCSDREVFSVTKEVDGRMRDPGGLIERNLGEPVTTRAWGTITRIVDKLV